MMKHFLRVGSLLLAGLWLSGCMFSFRNKERGGGLDVKPSVVLPIPQSGQIPIK
ncbi:hypothetical protein [Nibricoccus aquaticus]|uniref:hypothetical protein n=1 Tax=Nibricoccus aquaticus TaxID=2576891 RepID=UPI001586495B|nr:hypothetical protein [Nibricoccus aquaticus]